MQAVLPIAVREPVGQVPVDRDQTDLARKGPDLTGPDRIGSSLTGPSLTGPGLTEAALIAPRLIGLYLNDPDLTRPVPIDLSQTVVAALPARVARTGHDAREVDLRDLSRQVQASHGPVAHVPAASRRAARE